MEQPNSASQGRFASRRAVATDAQRPRTAGATCPTSFSRPWKVDKIVEHRIELQMPSQRMPYREGSQLFLFPTPSPRQPRSAIFPSSPLHSASPNGSPRIGIALGSPSQAKLFSFTRSDRTTGASEWLPVLPPPQRLAPTPPDAAAIAERPKLRQKKSNWQTFRNIFQRKTAVDVSQPFGITTNDISPEEKLFWAAARQGDLQLCQDIDMPAPLFATASRTCSTTPMDQDSSRERKNANSSNGNTTVDSLSIWKRLPNVPRWPADESSTVKHTTPPRKDSPVEHMFNSSESPRLDLGIPDPVMERYSVMFEQLLSSNQPKKSLLERRQSKLQNQGTQKAPSTLPISREAQTFPNDRQIPQRSLTSPHLTRIPSLSLDLSTITSKHPPTTHRRPHPIKRSNTAPPGALSPTSEHNLTSPHPLTPAICITPCNATSPFHSSPQTTTSYLLSPPLPITSPSSGPTFPSSSSGNSSHGNNPPPPTTPAASSFGSGHSPVVVSVAKQISLAPVALKRVQVFWKTEKAKPPRVVEEAGRRQKWRGRG